MIINLVEVKKHFKNLTHQKEAVEYLGEKLLKTKAKEVLKLSDSYSWIKLSEEQLTWLYLQISDNTLVEFAKIWRNEKPKLFAIADKSDRVLTLRDFQNAAQELNCDVASVRAVAKVESNGGGFLADGRPKILFEAHLFSQFSRHKFDGSYPKISSRKWNRSLYDGGSAEWDRLDLAMSIDRSAALISFSVGAFQVVGMNYRKCGYPTVEDFLTDNMTAAGQLRSLVNFIKNSRIDDDLRNKNWAGFARVYNGSAYHVHNYHGRLANAYREFINA